MVLQQVRLWHEAAKIQVFSQTVEKNSSLSLLLFQFLSIFAMPSSGRLVFCCCMQQFKEVGAV